MQFPGNPRTLPCTQTINGIRFNIDRDGFVSSPQSGDLGHLEDCMVIAETLSSLFELSQAIDTDAH